MEIFKAFKTLFKNSFDSISENCVKEFMSVRLIECVCDSFSVCVCEVVWTVKTNNQRKREREIPRKTIEGAWQLSRVSGDGSRVQETFHQFRMQIKHNKTRGEGDKEVG